VVDKVEAILLGNLALAFFNHLIIELDDTPCLGADHVVMMLFLGQLKYRMATLEVMAQHQTSRFKLRQHSIDRGQPNIITGFQSFL